MKNQPNATIRDQSVINGMPATAMDKTHDLRASLLDKLRSRTWRAGHRLPAERDLALAFGVSRSTVRRVLQDFKQRQLITQTVGSGTFVADQVQQALSAWAAPTSAALAISPADLMSARLVLEPAVIDLCVGNATAADFDRMDLCNASAEAATTLEEFERWDAALHAAIAQAAHNGFITAMLHTMNDVRSQDEWAVLKRRSAIPERRREYEAEHRALVLALRQRDADKARALCLAHLVHVRRNMLGY
jgi:DNA-binding FadR family transcriptional regulator